MRACERKGRKNPTPPLQLPAKRAAKPILCDGCLVVAIGSCQIWAGKPSRRSLRWGGKGSSAPGLGPRGSTVLVPHKCGDGGFPPKPVPRGYRAYLSSAPQYDFPRYRQLVHEITLAFNGISREVLCIAGRLRDELARPDLAQHLARLQEQEQEKLQLVSTGLGGWVGGPTTGRSRAWAAFWGCLSSRRVPTADGAAPTGSAAGTGPARRGRPSAGGAGAQAQVSVVPLPSPTIFWDGGSRLRAKSPFPAFPLPPAQGGPDGAFKSAFGRSPGEGLAMPRGRGPLGLPGLSVS